MAHVETPRSGTAALPLRAKAAHFSMCRPWCVLCFLTWTTGLASAWQAAMPKKTAEVSGSASSVLMSTFFCWSVQGPGDDTIDYVWRQLEDCGGRVIFSNYSNPTKGVIKLYEGDMRVGRTPAGWADNTDLFTAAWEFIGRSRWPDEFKWFVKVDADTFIRTRFLPRAVEQLDPVEPMTLTVDGRVRGALEITSFAAFRHPRSDITWTRNPALESNQELGGEDLWITWAFERAGFRLAEMKAPGCITFLLSYFNLPGRFHDNAKLAGGTRNVNPVLMRLVREEATRQRRYQDGDCISPDVIAIHPVKDIEVYKEFVRLDSELMDLEWKHVA